LKLGQSFATSALGFQSLYVIDSFDPPFELCPPVRTSISIPTLKKEKEKKVFVTYCEGDYTFKEATLFSCERDKRNLFTLNLETDGMQL